ncbi:cytidine deaminase [Aquimarina brevivitae]|uniref:Cytidine deaminase n=1 Tax=Aquimarina brevivitae TaxID=323412 RepID=A0A4Q7PH86_9FLAO|nr:cytidine deaminase [Aquimarina brevivitae]RZS99894.1 cytidine deaminase [Aquimarina brevivitae]
MKKIRIEAILEVFESLQEVELEVQQLMKQAMEARDKAYAPYSEFLVGAAILLANGEVVTGNNQENASYPSGLCAERTAIYYAGANFPKVPIQKMALTARSLKYQLVKPVPPCGACRQAIAEYEQHQQEAIEIYFMGEAGKVVKASSLADLLPLSFDSSYL